MLTAFDALPTFNVAKASPPFSVLIKATDDLSGVDHLLFTAVGPSGQRIPVLVNADYPATSFSRRVGIGWGLYSGRLLQPGTWTIDQARLVDLARNHSKYNQAALAALGNTSFTVVNNGPYDAVAPTLTGGQVLTPVVSLSAPARGTTNQAPFVGAKVTLADTGSTAVAGVAAAGVTFCLADESRCLDLMANPNASALATGTLIAGLQVSAVVGQMPGEYLLYEVVVIDQAGNMRELLSTVFGGTIDFSALFPTTKITLTP
jgi:hypothetical protein